jgi:hypothetical protein
MARIVKSEYEDLYLPADEYVTYNDNDDDLTPIVLKLPEPPPLHTIDGYGLHPYNQKFTRHEVPKRLVYLEIKAQEIVEKRANINRANRATPYRKQKEFWTLLEENKSDYTEEIKYIKKVHWHLNYGYWFFCKGKPTWISPWHYRYLNFGYIDDASNNYKPRYRDVDRRVYILGHYAYTAKETFANLDEDGFPVKSEDGTYKMKNVGRRVYYGLGKPKRRREGQTAQSSSDLLWIAERHRGVKCVVGADTGNNAVELFKDHMVKIWNAQPLFLRPINDVSNIEPSEISFTPPTGFALERNFLDTKIVVASSAGEGVVDRLKTYGILFDEAGKVERADVYSRHKTSKLTAAQGPNIHGWMKYPSTVEEMTDGGFEFQKLLDDSDFYKRNINGQTVSGLIRVFTPCWDGYDGYIDPWGYSVIETPTQEQLDYATDGCEYANSLMGAKEYWIKYYDNLLKSGDQSSYREELRKNPMRYADCWIGTSGDTGFDIVSVDRRLAQLRRKSETRRCTFRWEDKPWGKAVLEWDENGECEISDWEMLKEGVNLRYQGDPVYSESHDDYIPSWYPGRAQRFVIGVDPFDYKNRTQAMGTENKSRQSDGAIAVKWLYDPSIEESESRRDWNSDRFVITYLNRPPSEQEFVEYVARIAVWVGGLVNVETNKTTLLREFIENGFGGYLWRGQDEYGRPSKKYGTWTGPGSKNLYFAKTKDFVKYRVHKEKHVNYLKQIKNIKGPEDLTNQDLFTAGALCHVAETSYYAREIEKIGDVDINVALGSL